MEDKEFFRLIAGSEAEAIELRAPAGSVDHEDKVLSIDEITTAFMELRMHSLDKDGFFDEGEEPSDELLVAIHHYIITSQGG
jgi:hypothetical protein